MLSVLYLVRWGLVSCHETQNLSLLQKQQSRFLQWAMSSAGEMDPSCQKDGRKMQLGGESITLRT